MGRIRNGYEIPLFHAITEEVVDLFGIDEVTLHKHNPATQVIDPVWSEPNQTTVRYKQYRIKAMHIDPLTTYDVGDLGGIDIFENKLYVAMAHLLKAGVTADEKGDYIDEGDLIQIHKKDGDKSVFYDIIKAQRVGYMNDTSEWTGYDLDVRRNWKYGAERKEFNT